MTRMGKLHVAGLSILLSILSATTRAAYTPPASPRQTINFDRDWKFIRRDIEKGEDPGVDDSKWAGVTTPHTFNDIDTFNRVISHSGGQQGQYTGPAWYRKHFTLPLTTAGTRVLIEFDGMRQAGEIFLNGKSVGLSENGVTSYGVDLTPGLNPSGKDNLLAVRVDNSINYVERSSGSTFEWNTRNFNPSYGGLNRHVRLHILSSVHQTLPVFDGLGTTGVYVYAADIDPVRKTLTVNIDAQAQNESADLATVTLGATLVDASGAVVATFAGEPVDMVNGEKTVLHASGTLAQAKLWSPADPQLYTVYTTLSVDNAVVDVASTITGFRKAEFLGGAGKGGVHLNGNFVYLTGYAQRSSDEWAGLGQAYPDWMHQLTMQMVRDSHANYIRWMHVAPQPVDVEACDRAGIIEVCPAGDKEKDATGQQWQQRLDVMRDTMIRYRNNPSVLFWEAGNNGVSAEHLQQMLDLQTQWDPDGGRVLGCRSLTDPATTATAGYFGVMIGQDPHLDKRAGPDVLFRGYNDLRRDRAPIIETEDFRDEAARRFWDDASPPHFGFKPGPNDTYHWNSETFCLAAAARYWAYSFNRIDNPNPAHSRWSGYASIYFSDSNADGRQDSSEVARVSGKVDAVRLPKEAYFTYRVMQNPKPDLHLIGHWTYPAGTVKNVYVVANHFDTVTLRVNGKIIGTQTHPTDGYIYSFEKVAFIPGTIDAIGSGHGKVVKQETLTTAGPAVAIRLTPITGPGGLHADGADVALVTVEAVDAEGRRCPTDEARVDFAVTGPAVWRGGYNSGVVGSTNNLFLSTEDGINRVALRSTATAGDITLTATRPGLLPATLKLASIAIR